MQIQDSLKECGPLRLEDSVPQRVINIPLTKHLVEIRRLLYQHLQHYSKGRLHFTESEPIDFQFIERMESEKQVTKLALILQKEDGGSKTFQLVEVIGFYLEKQKLSSKTTSNLLRNLIDNVEDEHKLTLHKHFISELSGSHRRNELYRDQILTQLYAHQSEQQQQAFEEYLEKFRLIPNWYFDFFVETAASRVNDVSEILKAFQSEYESLQKLNDQIQKEKGLSSQTDQNFDQKIENCEVNIQQLKANIDHNKSQLKIADAAVADINLKAKEILKQLKTTQGELLNQNIDKYCADVEVFIREQMNPSIDAIQNLKFLLNAFGSPPTWKSAQETLKQVKLKQRLRLLFAHQDAVKLLENLQSAPPTDVPAIERLFFLFKQAYQKALLIEQLQKQHRYETNELARLKANYSRLKDSISKDEKLLQEQTTTKTGLISKRKKNQDYQQLMEFYAEFFGFCLSFKDQPHQCEKIKQDLEDMKFKESEIWRQNYLHNMVQQVSKPIKRIVREQRQFSNPWLSKRHELEFLLTYERKKPIDQLNDELSELVVCKLLDALEKIHIHAIPTFSTNINEDLLKRFHSRYNYYIRPNKTTSAYFERCIMFFISLINLVISKNYCWSVILIVKYIVNEIEGKKNFSQALYAIFDNFETNIYNIPKIETISLLKESMLDPSLNKGDKLAAIDVQLEKEKIKMILQYALEQSKIISGEENLLTPHLEV